MTVSYSSDIFNTSACGSPFFMLLFRWKGSFYKLIWRDLLIYISVYVGFSCIYRFALPPKGQYLFEQSVLLCKDMADNTPVTFILGFYVSILVARWWAEFLLIPWPDNLAVMVSAYICCNDQEGRLMKRTIVRYVNLAILMVLRMISMPVKRRFPTIKHLEEAGIIFGNECEVSTVFENHRKSLIQHCEQSELRLNFEWTKVN